MTCGHGRAVCGLRCAPACVAASSTATTSAASIGGTRRRTPVVYTPHVAPHAHEQKGPVRVAVLTVSDTRTRDDDESGALAETLLRDAGHDVVERAIVRDDVPAIRAELRRLLATARVVVTTGGTGITPRDSTYEAVSALIEKRLDGFGELFRALSFAEI